jgi:hypothetical protein
MIRTAGAPLDAFAADPLAPLVALLLHDETANAAVATRQTVTPNRLVLM